MIGAAERVITAAMIGVVLLEVLLGLWMARLLIVEELLPEWQRRREERINRRIAQGLGLDDLDDGERPGGG